MRDLINRSRIVIGAIRNGAVLHLRVVSDKKGYLYLVENGTVYTPFLNYQEAFDYMAGL